jgi:hypothetical protein
MTCALPETLTTAEETPTPADRGGRDRALADRPRADHREISANFAEVHGAAVSNETSSSLDTPSELRPALSGTATLRSMVCRRGGANDYDQQALREFLHEPRCVTRSPAAELLGPHVSTTP